MCVRAPAPPRLRIHGLEHSTVFYPFSEVYGSSAVGAKPHMCMPPKRKAKEAAPAAAPAAKKAATGSKEVVIEACKS